MNFRDLLQEKRVIFFDGAMGTLLQSQLEPGMPPEKLNLVAPQKISQIHLAYAKEGVDVIETNTFGANRIKLEKFNLSQKIKDINYQAVKIAKESATSQFIGASIGPLGNLIEPWGEITTTQAIGVFKEQIEILANAGADILVIETMMSLKEAKIAVIAAREVCDLPVICQLTFGKQGKTLMGTDPQTAAFTLETLDIEAIGANCSVGPEEMFSVVQAMRLYTGKPLIFQPNAGNPELVKGKTIFPVGPEVFSRWAKKFVENGVKIVGGCCGTTPEHIAIMVKNLKSIVPPVKKHFALQGISSRTKIYTFKEENSLILGMNFCLQFTEPDRILELVSRGKEIGYSFLNLNFKNINQGSQVSSTMNFIQQNTDMGITIELDEPSQIYPALSQSEGKVVVFLPYASWQKKEDLQTIKKLGAVPGMTISLGEKIQIKEQIETILQKCKEMKMSTREIAVKISLPPDFEHNFSFKHVIQYTKEIKSCISATVILQVGDFSRKVAGASLRKGSLLGIASWYNIEAALLNPEKKKSHILILRAAETLFQKDLSGEKFMNLMRGKNANR